MSIANKFLLSIFIFIVLLFAFNLVNKKGLSSNNKSEDNINQSDNNFTPQENERGNVTVIVTPKVLEIGKNPIFEIKFETHSVDLTFDVVQISSLVDEKGKVFGNSIWEGSEPGGHHREGTLTFNTVLSETKLVELIIVNVAGVTERKFKWNL